MSRTVLKNIAIGDAYGAGYEYVDPAVIRLFNTGFKYRQHPLHHDLAPGWYTDDTQMTLGLFSYLLKYGNKQESEELLWKEWFDLFKSDPIKGYSKGFQGVLETSQTVRELIKTINTKGSKSDKNGGAMRAMPCSFLPTVQQVKEFSGWQASLTHEGTGVLAAQAVALAGFYFRKNLGGKDKLGEFLNTTLGVSETWEWYEKVKSPVDLGLITAKAAITAVLYTNNLHDCLVQSVDFTGDVDTVAAISMGIASFDSTRTDDIPEGLKRGLRSCSTLEHLSAQELNLELMLMTE